MPTETEPSKEVSNVSISLSAKEAHSIYHIESQSGVESCDVLLEGTITDCLAGLTKTGINLNRNKFFG
jgi:hypothetical protein